MKMIGMSVRSASALLQIEAVEIRKRHVEHQAARDRGARARQKLLRRRERLRLPALDCGSSSSSDSRTEMSSSTTKTMGVACGWMTTSIGRPDRRTRSICSSSDRIELHALRNARVTASAAFSAPSRAVSLNGLNRHSTAPCASSARTDRLVAVRGDEDDRNLLPATRQLLAGARDPTCPAWRRRGSGTSSRSTHSDARNSSADENAWTAKPSSRSRSGSDSRTDSSSSTTDTSGRSFTIPHRVPAHHRAAPEGPRRVPAFGAGMENANVAPGPSFGFRPQATAMPLDDRAADGQGRYPCRRSWSCRRRRRALSALSGSSPTPASCTLSAHALAVVSLRPDQHVPRAILDAGSSRPRHCGAGSG